MTTLPLPGGARHANGCGFLLTAVALAPLLFFGGCAPQAMPREFAEIGKAIAVSLTDQAKWQSIVANIDGQVIEPGIRVEAGILYVAQARLVGVSGQVGISGSGEGTGEGPTDEARAAIRGELLDEGTLKRIIGELIRERFTTSQPSP